MINSASFTFKSTGQLSDKLETLLSEIDFKPTLAFCFISVDMEIKHVMEIIANKCIRLFGASSCGELLFDKNNETVSDKAAVITITDIAADSFSIISRESNKLKSPDFGLFLGNEIHGFENKSSVIIAASGLMLDGQALVEGIVEVNGNDLVMFGGLAGDDSKFEKTFVFTENEIIDDGAILLLLDKDKIEVSGIASSGWIGLGANLRITSSDGNIVYTIDDEPALDVYKSYLSVTDEELPAIGIEFPLMIKRKNGETALRAVIGINSEDKSLIFAGSVSEGSSVTFSSSPGFEVIKTTTSKLASFHEQDPEADLFILFSCMARHLALGPMVNQEIRFAADKWDAPVIGFFTYGEIGRNSNSCDFFNQTYTLVKLTEKNNHK
ncbi:MAG: hypothetical protein GXO88_15215 [Chlorobi bacterium]|nr:hypothetical protein [Chlorobiota bacterium]